MKKVKDLSFYIGKHLGLCRDSGVADNHSWSRQMRVRFRIGK
jgi:hypothetical protein